VSAPPDLYPEGGLLAFATQEDVEIRLGRVLSEAEGFQADAVITTVTGLIADAVDRSAAWAADLDPVPETLRALCVEKAIGAIANPSNLASESEQLGAHQRSHTFPRAGDVGLFLTDAEQRRSREAVYGATTGSSSPRSMIDRVTDLRENRGVDEEPG
jgi:hypothetical protein